jgi:hypothetical protein
MYEVRKDLGRSVTPLLGNVRYKGRPQPKERRVGVDVVEGGAVIYLGEVVKDVGV